MKEPQWITIEQALLIYQEVVENSVASEGLRDRGLLESALSRSQNAFFYQDVDLFELAAIYAEAIVRNHPFVDANKRTAFVTADVFLRLNGWQLKADWKALADLMVALANHEIPRSTLADFFRQNTKSGV
jgi:death on curing protein